MTEDAKASGSLVGGGTISSLRAVPATIIVRSTKGHGEWDPTKILQMDGDKVARELPAEHQLIMGGNRETNQPYIVYMPERDELLMLVNHECPRGSYHPAAFLVSSKDHGHTWSEPRYWVNKSATERLRVPIEDSDLNALALTYLGDGKLVMGGAYLWHSSDYGETWSEPVKSPPATHRPSWGPRPRYYWDPFLVDKDPKTGNVTRLACAGCSPALSNMAKAFADVEKLVTFPSEWKWRPDPNDRGLVEEWHKDESIDGWPKSMLIDKAWTWQGEKPGIGWYATSFEIPETGGVPLLILFGAVDGYCDVFIDGQKVGEQKQSPDIMWDRAFYIAVDGGLSPGRHRMIVRVEKDCWNAGIYQPVWIARKSDVKLPPPDEDKPAWPHVDGLIRFSYDGGLTWTEEMEPPSWNGESGVAVPETALCRATNGDIIAACRIRFPQWMDKSDHHGGLGVSISRDNGSAWSKISVLYELGRHHPSMALMPNGDIVMTYVVRMGVLETPERALDEEGFSQWGVEAVISRDNGASWDLEHRYVLAKWSGIYHAQNTSTVLLPDGSLLTGFGAGYRCEPMKQDSQGHEILGPSDVGLVRWKP